MGWSSKTKPTAANIRKRVEAAAEALRGAQTLADLHPTMGKKLRAPLDNALGWTAEARNRTKVR